MKDCQILISGNFDTNAKRNDKWETSKDDPGQTKPYRDPTGQVPGNRLSGRDWVVLNKLRAGRGRAGHTLHKWGFKPSLERNCGHEKQIATQVFDERFNRLLRGGMSELRRAW